MKNTTILLVVLAACGGYLLHDLCGDRNSVPNANRGSLYSNLQQRRVYRRIAAFFMVAHDECDENGDLHYFDPHQYAIDGTGGIPPEFVRLPYKLSPDGTWEYVNNVKDGNLWYDYYSGSNGEERRMYTRDSKNPTIYPLVDEIKILGKTLTVDNIYGYNREYIEDTAAKQLGIKKK